MFRFLRKLVLWTILILIAGAVSLYFRSPSNRRNAAQAAERVREQFNDKKKPTWTGTVVVADVLEGDTVVVNTEATPGIVACLAAVDAPEMPDKFKRNGQPLAEESRNLLATLVKDKAVEMSIVGSDPAKRPLVLLTSNDRIINVEMARAGLAEAGAEGSDALPARIRQAIENAELAARQQRTNIWALPNYVRPVEHRIRFPDPSPPTLIRR